MRFIARFGRFPGLYLTLVAVLTTTACSTSSESESSPLTACADPRPQVCTMIYAPVCAVHEDDRRETLASACNACADATVSAYLPQPCEDLETP